MKRVQKRCVASALCIAILACAFLAGNYISCLAEEKGAEYALPVLMYHHILKETSKQGAYVISPAEFEADLKYLKEKGYTTIGIKELCDYKEKGTPLPEKPIMLTFDDGYLSYLEYAVPLLEKYEMKAVVSVVGAYCDTYTENRDRCISYAYFSWDDVRKLSQSCHTEIQNHTYDMHKACGGQRGCARRKGENREQYRMRFTEDVGKMQALLKEHTGNTAACFTYPFGFCCGEAEEVLRGMGFSASLCCEEGINYLSRNSSFFMLKRFNREHNRSAESILKKTR